MDLGTIKNQMEAIDGTGYKQAREIFADVRLVFKKLDYVNDDRSNVHVVAKTLMAKFEKWPKLGRTPRNGFSEVQVVQQHLILAC